MKKQGEGGVVMLAMYLSMVFSVACFCIIGVVYGIRGQKRKNWAKKIVMLIHNKAHYSQWIATVGEPKFIGTHTDENGVSLKTASWVTTGAYLTILFDEKDCAIGEIGGGVTE